MDDLLNGLELERLKIRNSCLEVQLIKENINPAQLGNMWNEFQGDYYKFIHTGKLKITEEENRNCSTN